MSIDRPVRELPTDLTAGGATHSVEREATPTYALPPTICRWPPAARAPACTPGRATSATVSFPDAHSRQRGDRLPTRGLDSRARVSPVAGATGRAPTVDRTGTRSGGGAAAPRHRSGGSDCRRYGRRDHRAARDAPLTGAAGHGEIFSTRASGRSGHAREPRSRARGRPRLAAPPSPLTGADHR